MTTDPPWVDLIAADAVAPGRAHTVLAGDRAYAVCNDAGRFAVVDNACPHAGGNLGRGDVRDGRIVCPWHGCQWELATGRPLNSCARRLRTYPTKTERGRVFALLDSPG